MHGSSRMLGAGLVLLLACRFAAYGSTPTSGPAGTSSTTATTGSVSSSGTMTTHGAGNGLLCAALLGSGLLSDVFSVAPLVPARHGDADTAVSFGSVWSQSHQATVGSAPAISPGTNPAGKLSVATVKLPIAFSDADRIKFEAAGWKLHHSAGGSATTYCLNRSSADDTVRPALQGMICVAAAP